MTNIEAYEIIQKKINKVDKLIYLGDEALRALAVQLNEYYNDRARLIKLMQDIQKDVGDRVTY